MGSGFPAKNATNLVRFRGAVRAGANQGCTQNRGHQGAHGADDEGELIACVERCARVAVLYRLCRAAGGKADQDREAQGPTHHEGRVDHAGSKARLNLFNVAHRREQDGVEGHARADAEQRHGRQHMQCEDTVDGCDGKQRKTGRGEEQAQRQR